MNFSFKYHWIFIAILFGSISAFGQPVNNICSTATVTISDGTCYNGTTVNADDTWIGAVGCQGNGNNPESWFSFVATGTTAEFTVTSAAISPDPGIGGNIEIILVEDTLPPCGVLFLEGSYCGPSPITNQVVSTSMTVGATYYYTISSSGSTGSFTTCVNTSSSPPSPGFDCTTADALCNSSSFDQGTFTGVGASENILTNSCFGQNERQSKWYTFSCMQSGTFELLIDPLIYNSASQSGDDFDFALWDVSSGCYNSGITMGTPLACNWSGCSGSTGISSSAPYMGENATTDYQVNNPPGPGTCNPGTGPPLQWETTVVNLIACNTYALLIDNFTSSSGGFTANFGGTAVIGPKADFSYSITDDQPGDCRILNLQRPVGYCSSGALTYSWNFGDGTTSTLESPGTHTFSVDGLYTVSLVVTDANGCMETFSQTVDVGCLVLPIELLDFDPHVKENEVVIEWTTSVEVNNDYFTIERSKDGFNYEVISQIAGAGFSSMNNSYEVIDTNPLIGSSYYRLRQTDFDGQNKVFPPVAVYFSQEVSDLSLIAFGNFKEYSIISSHRQVGPVSIDIHNVQGSQVFHTSVFLQEGVGRSMIDLSDLAPGMYIARLSARTGQFNSWLVIQ